jgi:hypothetical protein
MHVHHGGENVQPASIDLARSRWKFGTNRLDLAMLYGEVSRF